MSFQTDANSHHIHINSFRRLHFTISLFDTKLVFIGDGVGGVGREDNNFLELTRHVLAITLYRLFYDKSGRL